MTSINRRLSRGLLVLTVVLFATAMLAAPATAPERAPGYDLPPQYVLDVLHAPAPPRPMLSPTRTNALLVSWVQFPQMSQVAEPYLKLAGVRVEPRTRRKHDTPGGYGVAQCAQTLSVVDIATRRETPIALPAGGCADGFTWSADGASFAFRNTSRDAVELWAGGRDGATHRVGTVRLNPMLGSSHQWMPDNRSLLVKLVPEGIAAPAAAEGAEGPRIEESVKGGESSTYEARDTLRNQSDAALFEFYGTSQLALVDSASGDVKTIGAPAVITDIEVSPDGEYILLSSIRKPYSYSVTYGRFAHDVEVWDRAGKITPLAQLPIADHVPIRGVPVGPRDHEWRPTEPATLVWAEALDGGDWKTKVPARDKVLMLAAPFTAAPVEIARTEQRFAGIDWSERRGLGLLQEYDENRHWRRTFFVDIDHPETKPRLIWDLSSDESYANPGRPVYRLMPNGQYGMIQKGDTIFLTGQGASPAGDRPFLDSFNLATRKAQRLFRSAKDAYEYPIGFAGGQSTDKILTLRQTPVDPPNLMLRTLGKAVKNAEPGEATVTSTVSAITSIPDPTPALRSIKKRLVTYKRKDGVDLSFTLYTPPDYKEGTRLPAILYAYPQDYASASTAGQITGSQQTFTNFRNYQLLLLSGYALIDNASFPVVGDPQKAYDTYIEQLIDDAQAAVDKAVELGVVDRDRIGVTGHSHGAMMTANLVAHTDLFRAGVATSGAYNKTLTPFGFQNERRSVWNALDTYLKVSPYFYANKMRAPLLIIHGSDDANPGTTPIQSEQLYQAIRGNGGTTRLVMLPHEPHWYSSMESNEQLAFEFLRWFDKYVKNAEPRQAK